MLHTNKNNGERRLFFVFLLRFFVTDSGVQSFLNLTLELLTITNIQKEGNIWVLYLHDWVGSQNSLLHTGLLCCSSNHSEISHGELCRDSFPRARFPTDDDRLVLLLPLHKDTVTMTSHTVSLMLRIFKKLIKHKATKHPGPLTWS